MALPKVLIQLAQCQLQRPPTQPQPLLTQATMMHSHPALRSTSQSTECITSAAQTHGAGTECSPTLGRSSTLLGCVTSCPIRRLTTCCSPPDACRVSSTSALLGRRRRETGSAGGVGCSPLETALRRSTQPVVMAVRQLCSNRATASASHTQRLAKRPGPLYHEVVCDCVVAHYSSGSASCPCCGSSV